MTECVCCKKEKEHILTPETIAQLEEARKALQEGKGLRLGPKEALKELEDR